MKEGLVVKRRTRPAKGDSWVYFICPKDNEKLELAVAEITFLDKATSIFWIENCSFRTPNYIKGLGKDIFDYIVKLAKKRGHEAIIWEWLVKEDNEKGLDFIRERGFKLMNEDDYIRFKFDNVRDRHEYMDYILELSSV